MVKSGPLWRVDKVLNFRDVGKGKREYQVKWTGYPDSANTWEPAANLTSDVRREAEQRWPLPSTSRASGGAGSGLKSASKTNGSRHSVPAASSASSGSTIVSGDGHDCSPEKSRKRSSTETVVIATPSSHASSGSPANGTPDRKKKKIPVKSESDSTSKSPSSSSPSGKSVSWSKSVSSNHIKASPGSAVKSAASLAVVSPPKVKKQVPRKTEKPGDRKDENGKPGDKYFMEMASISPGGSVNSLTQNTAVIVDQKKRVIAVGYDHMLENWTSDRLKGNGSGSDSEDIVNQRSKFMVHAEVDALSLSRTSADNPLTMYLKRFPCVQCAKAIAESAVDEVVYAEDEDEASSFTDSQNILSLVNKSYRKFRS